MNKGLNIHDLAEYNRALIRVELFSMHSASASELSKKLGLTVQSISKTLKIMEAQGEIIIVNKQENSRGNFAGMASLLHDCSKTVCVEIRPDRFNMIVSDYYGTPITEIQSISFTAASAYEVIEKLERNISNLVKTHHIDDYRIALAIHGQVDSVNGISIKMPQLDFRQSIQFKYILENRLHVEVRCDNDCVMKALAQKWHLIRTENKKFDFSIINADYGIGSAFFIDGSIYRGSMFGSGQIGHVIVNSQGEKCNCGRYGCLETVASKSSILRDLNIAYRLPGSKNCDLTFDDAVKLYLNKDAKARLIANRAAEAIGTAIYNFINVVNINKIFIYGDLCRFGPDFLDRINSQIEQNPFERRDEIKELTTECTYGKLSEKELLCGISYLYAPKLTDV